MTVRCFVRLIPAFLFLSPTFVGAACVQADVAGTWQMTGHTSNVASGAMSRYVSCKLVIASTGAVISSRSSCRARNGGGRFNLSDPSGTIRVSSACAMSGTLAMGNVNVIEFGQMSRDKLIFTAEGYLRSDPQTIHSWVFVRQ